MGHRKKLIDVLYSAGYLLITNHYSPITNYYSLITVY
jgi:hypothetical protein